MNLLNIDGIGDKTIKLLEKIDLFNIEDLLNYYPYRYNVWSITNIEDVNADEFIVIKGIIETDPKVSYIKKNFNRLSFKLNTVHVLINVTIFNRAFMKNNLTIGRVILISGKYDKNKNNFIASDIRFDVINSSSLEPIYHLVNGLKNKSLRNIIDKALETKYNVIDYIPEYLNEKYNFINKNDAIKYIHKPTNNEDLKKAKLKLIYEELFLFMFKIGILKARNNKEANGIGRKINISKVEELIDSLPFELTTDQVISTKDILRELESKVKMNRLILGDVGSGKTVVAIIAMYANYLSGYQSALMAPTEILTTQHYYNLQNLLKNTDITIELLVGSQTKKEKDNIIKRLRNNEIDIVIGTHALISNSVEFYSLGLVITDEQHRFGVNQRGALQNKGKKPDIIYLSATPIPRTYALTLYGDMDVSIIKSKPNGRKEIKTEVISDKDIRIVLAKILEEIKKGHQVYVVSPVIDESEEGDLKDVNKLKENFQFAFNNKINIGILHGKLKNQEKEAIMNDFKNNKIQILISTTVIEVGIDIKNATMIVIFNAERFGLATLHQLRGRVGRNDLNAYCFLICNKEIKRLRVMEESNDGFYISEKDFELRGEGDLFGVRQSGDMSFKVANIKHDYKILLQAKKDADDFINRNIDNNFENELLYHKLVKEMEIN